MKDVVYFEGKKATNIEIALQWILIQKRPDFCQ